jgi:hypothetical protein
MDEEHIAELETLISSEANGRHIALDLKNLTLAGQDAIRFLERCEADGITLMNWAGLRPRVDHKTTTRKLARMQGPGM